MDLAWVAGVDEAGRGPLAGPVFAAAVILDPARPIEGLRDSKKLTAAARERLAPRIRAEALACSVAWADAEEIDALDILRATFLAMRRALMGLQLQPASVLVDGNRLPPLSDLGLGGRAIVKGDSLVPAISAASILAKCARDECVRKLDERYPGYRFGEHKGYPTPVHLALLRERGASPVHRRSFAPVRAVIEAKSPEKT
ncbi:MAG: ribonuclease [Pseudomonadota bacterium]|jgi:ribonuclease HII